MLVKHSSFGYKLSRVLGLLVLFESVICREAAAGLLLTDASGSGCRVYAAVRNLIVILRGTLLLLAVAFLNSENQANF